MKKKLMAVLAIVLVIAMSVAGTYAYLTAKTQVVTNTFTAASGVVEKDSLVLDENKVKLVNGAYQFDTTVARVTSNTYDKVVPGMNIVKNPALSADVVDGVNAYIFVEVKDNTKGNIILSVNSENWTKLNGVTGANGGDVYAYAQGVVYGTSDNELQNIEILTGNQVTAADTLTGLDKLDLQFYGYACQADGFTDATNAYNTCFAPAPQGE